MTIAILGALFLSLVAVLLLSVGLFVGKKRFPSGHIHDSQAMRERGITCTQDQMREATRKKNLRERLEESN